MNTIRSINDHFRATCVAINVTPSIQALGPEFFRRAIKIVRHYDNFREDVNPYEEHDCGTFKLDGYECAWAIDCYNRDMSGPSADPCNVNITTRLLTISLAHEL